jgi:4-hydroxy-3-methylbut-2-enyl diphosphate reductase IspH
MTTQTAPFTLKIEKLVLAKVRGFCAGVVRAIEVVERALELCGGKVYVRHEIIHNRSVIGPKVRKQRNGFWRSKALEQRN